LLAEFPFLQHVTFSRFEGSARAAAYWVEVEASPDDAELPGAAAMLTG
jgi:hypothetical protein